MAAASGARLFALSVLFVSGCGSKGTSSSRAAGSDGPVPSPAPAASDAVSPAASPATSADASASAAPAAAPAPDPAVRSGSSVAFFAVDAPPWVVGRRSGTESVFRVQGGRVERIEIAPCNGPISDLAVSKEGTAYLRCRADQIYEIADVTPVPISLPGCSVPDFIAGADRSLWALCDDAHHGHVEAILYRHDGRQFLRDSPEDLNLLLEPRSRRASKSVAIDAAGRPHLATSTAVLTREGSTWASTPVDPPADHPRLLATADGSVFLDSGRSLREVANGRLGEPRPLEHHDAVRRPRGGMALLDKFAGALLFADASHRRTPEVDLFAGSLFVNRAAAFDSIAGFAVDGQDRVWVATTVGLFVVLPDGPVEHWEPGRVSGLPMLPITTIAVNGDGPALPALGPKVRGTLVGEVPTDHPVTVALCMSEQEEGDDLVLTRPGAPPCAKSPERILTQTGATGAFRIENVPPLPSLTLLVERSDVPNHFWSRHTGCCADLRPGEIRRLELHPPGATSL